MLKIRLLFKKFTTFTGKFLGLRIQIFRVLISYEHKHIDRFSNLHQCTFKRRFNRSHVTKMSVQTFVRGQKKRIQLGKTLHKFPDFINRNYFTLILKKMNLTSLVNSVTGMKFHNTEAATGGALKLQIKVSQNSQKTSLPVSLFNRVAGLKPAIL